MKLSKENRDALLFQIHQTIYDTINFSLKGFNDKNENSLEYYVLTDDEEKYINNIKSSPLLKSVIKKILTRSLDDAFFNVLGIIDGTSEPLEKFGKKSDYLLIDMPEDYNESYDFLHEMFFDLYDEWEKMNR